MEYLTDKTHGLVKIIERNNKFFVYPLKRMEIRQKRGGLWGEESYKFIFSTKSIDSYLYKPYEDSDITNPQWKAESIKKSFYHLISKK